MQTIPKTLLLGLVACGGTPLAQIQTSNTAPLRLELVANESNAHAYQLHLCNTGMGGACRVALLDEQGKAATIYPDKLPRSFFATYKGYALLALAAVAIPVVGVTIWRKWLRHADEVLVVGQILVQNQRHAYQQQTEQLQKEIAEQIDAAEEALNEALRRIKVDSNDEISGIQHNEIIAKLEEVLDVSSANYFDTDYYLELMGKDMTAAIDEIVADTQTSLRRQIKAKADSLAELEMGSKGERSEIRDSIKELVGEIEELDNSIAAKLDAGTLHADVNKQDLAKLDEIFAEQLAQRKRSFQLGDDGLEFYQKMVQDTPALQHIENLRFMEHKQQLLRDIKAGHTLDTTKLKTELQELNVPVTDFFRQDIDIYYYEFPEDKLLFEQLDALDDTKHVPGMLLRADAVQAQGGWLYRKALTHLLEIRVKEESIELAEKIKNNKLDLDAALAKIDEDIAAAQDVFFADIDAGMLTKTQGNDAYAFAKNKEINRLTAFQERLLALDLDGKPPSQDISARLEKIAAMKSSLSETKEDMEKASVAIADMQQELETLPQKTAELKKHITAWEAKLTQVETKATERAQQARDTHAQRMAELEQRQLTQQEQEAKDLRKLVEQEEALAKQLAKQHGDTQSKAQVTSIAASAGLLGATAVFDRFVWGTKQRQQRRHWQVLSERRAIKITDVKEAKKILHSIASISGYRINPTALVLLGETPSR